jgi:hypothetical protein
MLTLKTSLLSSASVGVLVTQLKPAKSHPIRVERVGGNFFQAPRKGHNGPRTG